jgi:hypothetical protein
MKTEDLVERLSAEAGGVTPGAEARWLSGALIVGGALSFALLAAWLGLRPMHLAMRTPSFWMKGGYSLALALAGGLMVWRQAAPAGRIGPSPYRLIAAGAGVPANAGMLAMRATS